MSAMVSDVTLKATYYRTQITMHVEFPIGNLCVASITITHERRIVAMFELLRSESGHWHSVEQAQAWLGRSMGERGNFIEWASWMAETGQFQREPAAA